MQAIIRQNAFDIDTSGKATFYGNLEVKGSLPNILCGNSCTNIGNYSYAGGLSTKSGAYSLSHGSNCNFWVTPGTNCACFGLSCDTPVNSSFACGQYNIGEGKIFSVGNGSNDEKVGITRSNAFDIDASGKATFYRNLEVKKSLNCGNNNQIDENVEGAFACGKYNIGINKIFSIGNGKNDGTLDGTYSNVFDIDTSGKATFYEDIEVKGVSTANNLYCGAFPASSNKIFAVGIGTGTNKKKNAIHVWLDSDDNIYKTYIDKLIIGDNLLDVEKALLNCWDEIKKIKSHLNI